MKEISTYKRKEQELRQMLWRKIDMHNVHDDLSSA
jgi:hypothetical protein